MGVRTVGQPRQKARNQSGCIRPIGYGTVRE